MNITCKLGGKVPLPCLDTVIVIEKYLINLAHKKGDRLNQFDNVSIYTYSPHVQLLVHFFSVICFFSKFKAVY